jgi:hypothetical protein
MMASAKNMHMQQKKCGHYSQGLFMNTGHKDNQYEPAVPFDTLLVPRIHVLLQSL